MDFARFRLASVHGGSHIMSAWEALLEVEASRLVTPPALFGVLMLPMDHTDSTEYPGTVQATLLVGNPTGPKRKKVVKKRENTFFFKYFSRKNIW